MNLTPVKRAPMQVEKPLTGLERFNRDLALRIEREQAEKVEKRCTGNPSYTLREVGSYISDLTLHSVPATAITSC